MSERPDAASGENPSPMRIAPVTATGVPKPDAPSKKAPKENAINRSCSRRSARTPADGLLQSLETAGRDRKAVHEDDVEHDPADREESRHGAEHGRTQRHVGRHGEQKDRYAVGDDQGDDRGDVRLDL